MRLFNCVAAAAFALSGGLGLVTGHTALAQSQLAAPPRVSLDHYGDLPSIEEAEVSPNGTYTALLMTTQGERVITVLDASGNPVKQIVVGDAKVRGIEWVGEEAILLLRTETGRLPRQYTESKAEFLRGNVIPLDDARPVVSIFAEQRYIANAITRFYGIRQINGRWTGYFGGFRRGSTSGNRDQLLDRRPALFAVDLATGETDLKAYPDDYPATRNWLIGDDGDVGAVLQLDARNGNWRVENGDGNTIARGRQERGQVSLIGFDGTGSDVIYSYYDDALGGQRRFQIPLSGGTPTEIWEGAIIRRFVVRPFSSKVLGFQNEGDGSIDLSDDRAQAILSEVLGNFSHASYAQISDFTPDFSTLTAVTSGNYDSGTWFRINAATGERAILGLERPAIQGPAIGKVSTFTYAAQDGLEITGILTLPPGREAENLPVVILPHGGPTAHDVERFDWLAQAFASRGYAVLQPNFRGSTGRGAGFVEAGDGEWGRKMQTDKSDGLMALAQAGIADLTRACIVGSSYGGYAALAGVTLQQGIYRCAVSVNGVSDLVPLLRDSRTGSRDIFTRSFDRQFGSGADLNAISPRDHARNADAPVLLIHARDDTVVPFAQSLLMKDALEDAGKQAEFLALDGEDHWLSQSATRRQMLNAAVAFVERHNPAD